MLQLNNLVSYIALGLSNCVNLTISQLLLSKHQIM